MDPARFRAASAKLETDPYDLDAWSLVIKEAQTKPVDHSRDTFERLVEKFPTSGRYWKMYIDHEMRGRDYERVEKLFQRCLVKILNIDLWKTYLNYVKETKSSLPTYKEKLAQAYNFALEKMGMDIASFPIWNEYIRFLKSADAVGSYAENQKIAWIRKVYQRAVVNPMLNIEQAWKDYSAFEKGVNAMIAEKLIGERGRDYMTARRVSKEYEVFTRGINKSVPSVPPTGSADELKQIEMWQRYISWERSNPLRVEDPALVTKRVMFAYEQALLCLGHHPNIWHEAAVYLQDSSRSLSEKGDVDASRAFLEQASSMYSRATTGLLSRSMMLHFAYADFEEQLNKNEKVHEIYKQYLAIEGIDPTLCYIQYMKFCRRTEGTASARAIFKKAREDSRSTYHVFVAAALMEYYCTKDKKIAANIFELGFKNHKSNEEYILAYIDFLSHQNEDNNTRVLFERSLTSGCLRPEQQTDIWNKFIEFEANLGDMASIIKVEKRRAAALEKSMADTETTQLIDRYKFIDLFPCSADELQAFGYRDASSRAGKRLAGAGAKENDTGSGGTVSNGTGTDSGDSAQSAKKKETDSGVARPDFSQMVPYKPKFIWYPGEHRMPGGEFPFPPAVADLCQFMPPPASFQGPFVMVDRLMEVFAKMQLPDTFHAATSANNGHSKKLFDAALSVNWAAGGVGGGGAHHAAGGDHRHGGGPDRKRKGGGGGRGGGRNDSEEEDDGGSAAPVNDIYRKRQQKKMR